MVKAQLNLRHIFFGPQGPELRPVFQLENSRCSLPPCAAKEWAQLCTMGYFDNFETVIAKADTC